MRNRLSSHIFVLLALIAVEVVGYFAIYRSGLIRGYETSWIGAARDLLIFFPLIVAAFWLSRRWRFKGSWVLYTTAIVLFGFALAFSFCMSDRLLSWVQRNSFIIVLVTLLPLAIAIINSSAGKSLGNTTPWEPAKVPFLLGFAGLLTARYKDLARTYWGIPRARDIIPLLVMAVISFISLFALKDFWQMLIFSGAYATLYLVAVRRWPQLLVFVGSIVLVISILVIGALPRNIQEKVPLLPTVARPIQAALPARIQQRFHLWLDGFDPPSPEVSWWKKDYDETVNQNPELKEIAQQSPALQ